MKSKMAIGVDVGGSKIAAGIVDPEDGRLIQRLEIPTLREQGGADVLERLIQLIARLHSTASEMRFDIAGVGIGLPELVDNAGQIKSGWNFDWHKRDITSSLALFGRTVIDSDARTAALAESCFGFGVEFSSFVFITVGTGLSCAFCTDGKIHRGANGYAIHFASGDIMAVCNGCGEQTPFNLEGLASGHGLATTYHNRTGKVTDARAMLEGRAGYSGRRLMEQAVKSLASFIAQLVNTLDPHAVVIGGGLGTDPEFFSALERNTRQYIWAEDCRSLPILPGTLGLDQGVIGAALLVGSTAKK